MKRIASTVLALATVMFGLVVPGSPAVAVDAGAQAATDGTESPAWLVQKIRNYNSRLCLVARGDRGSHVEQTDCADFPDQDWEIRPYTTDSPLFQFRNVHSGLCLLARTRFESWATVDTCNKNYSDQLWWADGTAHVEYLTYHNVDSGLCLAARQNHPAIQTLCDDFIDQLWFPW